MSYRPTGYPAGKPPAWDSESLGLGPDSFPPAPGQGPRSCHLTSVGLRFLTSSWPRKFPLRLGHGRAGRRRHVTCLVARTFRSVLSSLSAWRVPSRAANISNIESFLAPAGNTHTLASRAEFSNGDIYRDGSGAAFRETRVAAGRGPGTPLPRRGKGSDGHGGLAELEPVSGNRQKLLEETRPPSSPWRGGARRANFAALLCAALHGLVPPRAEPTRGGERPIGVLSGAVTRSRTARVLRSQSGVYHLRRSDQIIYLCCVSLVFSFFTGMIQLI